MKYLKITLALFVGSLCLSLSGVQATQYIQLSNVDIPWFKGIFTSKQVDKGDWTYNQKVKKISAVDKLSGDGRAIEGRIIGLLAGMNSTGWQELPQGKNIDFGEDTKVQGGWKLQLRSIKSLATEAKVIVNWDLGTISGSPYTVKG